MDKFALLLIAKYELRKTLEAITKFVWQLGRYDPSSPSTKEVHASGYLYLTFCPWTSCRLTCWRPRESLFKTVMSRHQMKPIVPMLSNLINTIPASRPPWPRWPQVKQKVLKLDPLSLFLLKARYIKQTLLWWNISPIYFVAFDNFKNSFLLNFKKVCCSFF